MVSDDLIAQVRDRFAHVDSCPFQGERIFFENAGGALTLKSVVETSAMMAAVPDNPGRLNPAGQATQRMVEKGKDDLRLFFNAAGGQVMAGESGTELLYRLISAACLGAGEGSVVGASIEHPATRSACRRWAEIAGLEYRQAGHDDAAGLVTPVHYLPLIGPETRVATIVHASPVTGMGMDVAAIARAIREASPDCLIIVDGIQRAAHGGIDVTAADVDGYVISPYKVFSRHGYGLAWASDRLAALPHNHLDDAPGDPWELGTRDAGSYATFSDVVRYFEWLGGEVGGGDDPRDRIEAAGRAIHRMETALTDAMLKGVGNQKGLVEMPGVRVIGGVDNPAREGLVSFSVDGVKAADIVERLNQRGIRTHTRSADHYSGNVLRPLGLDGAVRVSVCHYNTVGEVARFLAEMQDITG